MQALLLELLPPKVFLLALLRAFAYAPLPVVVLLAAFPSLASDDSLAAANPQNYMERANKYRLAGDTRREQLELTNALRIWPKSAPLHYTYALHMVRRKNLNVALKHTTHSLDINSDQPATANLHLRILGQLKRYRLSANWVGQLLRENQKQPPLLPWSPEWLERWRTPLQVGRQHAGLARDLQTAALIDYALIWPAQ